MAQRRGMKKVKVGAVKRKKTARRKAKKRKVGAVKRKKPARKKTSKKKPGTVKRKKPARKKPSRKKSTGGLHLVKNVTKSTTERVMAGRKRRKRKAGSIGTAYRRRRSVGRSGSNTGLIIAGVALGALALYLLTKKPETATGTYQNVPLPPLIKTGNYTRDTNTQDIVGYAIAAGLAVDAVIKLIDRLNASKDDDIKNIYDHVNTTGDVGILA